MSDQIPLRPASRVCLISRQPANDAGSDEGNSQTQRHEWEVTKFDVPM